ncbi:MAG: extracellular solute-binding protein [Pseudomonadota bacterium]
MQKRLTGKWLAAGMVAGLAGSLGLMQGAAAEGELNFYNWTDYTSPELIAKFEAETGIKVNLDAYDSNESLLAKLKSGAVGYDLAVPSQNFITIMIEEGMLEEMNAFELPNFSHVDERWRYPAWDPQQKYSAPWQFGTTSFSIRSDAGAGSCDTLKTFFEPGPAACGKLGVFKTPEEVVGLAQIYLGQELCTDDGESMKAIQALLQKQKQCVLVYSSEATTDRLANNETVVSNTWNGDVMRIRLEGAPVEYCYPKEGILGWYDSLVIPKGAPNLENARTFVNFLMQPENMALQSNFARYSNAISASTAHLDEDLASAPEIAVPSDVPVTFAENCSAKYIKSVDRIWTRLLQ